MSGLARLDDLLKRMAAAKEDLKILKEAKNVAVIVNGEGPYSPGLSLKSEIVRGIISAYLEDEMVMLENEFAAAGEGHEND